MGMRTIVMAAVAVGLSVLGGSPAIAAPHGRGSAGTAGCSGSVRKPACARSRCAAGKQLSATSSAKARLPGSLRSESSTKICTCARQGAIQV